MSITHKKKIILGTRILIVVLAIVALYFIGLPLLKLMLPFILAGLIAILMEPVVLFMQQKLKLGRKLSSFLSLISVLVVFGSIISLALYKIVIELISLSKDIPRYFTAVDLGNESLYWSNLSNKLYLSIPPDAATYLQVKITELVNLLSSYATQFITSILTFVFNMVAAFPEIFIVSIITIISTYFISSDKEKIKAFIFKQFPEHWEEKIYGLKNDLLLALLGFFKAQLMLISISMFIATVGLSILNVKYAVTMGIIIGLFEIIPMVGTGSIFIPWIIIELFYKNYYLALGMFATFILGIIVRQMMEPKILGVQIGIYPLVALISIYIGLELFGVFGMLLGPIMVIVLRNLNKSGVVHLWKE